MNPIQSPTSSFGARTLAPRDILHTWSLKEYTVHLFTNENILKCEMIDHSGKEVYKATIDIPVSYTIEKMIAKLKQCKILLKNEVPNFRLPVNTWHLENKEVHLLPDTNQLLWNIVEESNTEGLFFSFQEVTIPSERCHLETVALIEKIKEDSLNRTYKNYLKTDFHVVRVLTPGEIPEEIRENEKNQLSLLDNQEKETKSNVNKGLAIGTGTGSAALYLSWNAIGAATGTAASWLGSGTMATIATGALGVGLGTASFGIGMALPLFHFMPKIESLYTTEMGKARHVANHIHELIIERPLFVEIQPISLPSEIDDRMLVSKFTWAVTLVTHGGDFDNHAQIIVEGINDGFYNEQNNYIQGVENLELGAKFAYMCELKPPINSKIFTKEEKLNFFSRSEIWMRSAFQTKKMIENIEQEKATFSYSFNYWGIRSMFYKFNPQKFNLSGKKGDNCFTWSQKKLKLIDVDLGEKITDHAAGLARNHTAKPENYPELPVKQLI